jgi:hypothetical protein
MVPAFTPLSVVYHSGPEDFLPGLPLVSAPFAPKSDVVSLVPHRYGALSVGVVSIVALAAVQAAPGPRAVRAVLDSRSLAAAAPRHIILAGRRRPLPTRRRPPAGADRRMPW